MKRDRMILAFLSFALYFLTGAVCLAVGSGLVQLVDFYGRKMSSVVYLSSAFAVGRVLTVYQTGRVVEWLGPKRVFAAGTLLLSAFLVSLCLGFYAGLIGAFLGGIGMGAQDTVCPLLLSRVYPTRYAGALSAGQALFGMGGLTVPFILSRFLKAGLPFYRTYLSLLAVSVLMLAAIPLVADWERGVRTEEQRVQPLYAKRRRMVLTAMVLVTVCYCAGVNTISLYASSFAVHAGASEVSAALLLTTYHLGSAAGAVAFIFILRRIRPVSVLVGNQMIAFAALAGVYLSRSIKRSFVLFFIAGFVLGVLYSVIVTIATRIGWRRISVAGALIATAGGGADILTPIVTGRILEITGVHFSIACAMLMTAAGLAAALVLYKNLSEKEVADGAAK